MMNHLRVPILVRNDREAAATGDEEESSSATLGMEDLHDARGDVKRCRAIFLEVLKRRRHSAAATSSDQ